MVFIFVFLSRTPETPHTNIILKHQNWNVLERNQSLRYRIICDVIKGYFRIFQEFSI